MGEKAKLRGVFTAMITPFKGDYGKDMPVDFDGFQANLVQQLNERVTPVVLGTTGEAPQINDRERRTLVSIAVQKAREYAINVVVGVTSENYEHMMRKAKDAKEQGANFILVTPTPYVKQQQHDIFRMYQDLNKIGIPMIVYNIQSRVGVNIETATLRKIAELENVVGVKEASGNLEQMKEVIDTIVAERPDFSVLSGDDNKTYSLLTYGGDGVVSVVSNLVPWLVVDMVDSYLADDKETAAQLDGFLRPLYEAAFIEGNPQSMKWLMRLAGMPAGPTRPPLYDLKPGTEEKLREVLSIYELNLGEEFSFLIK